MDRNKVVLGLSGGVDSAVAALVLKSEGLDVTGLYFDITEGNDEGREAARKVAYECGIDFVYVNVHERFEKEVVEYFCREYSTGRTPNPCIVCNPAVKFQVLAEYADKVGAYHIATGHYAKTVLNPDTDKMHIAVSRNVKKDQSYMLYRLPQDIIARLILPLEQFGDKSGVREYAAGMGLTNSGQKDSQEICFIDDSIGYAQFLKAKGYTDKEGNYVDIDGNILGTHKGIMNYTIGQRKGLGITFGKPAYVVGINNDDNTVVIGDNSDLFRSHVYIDGCFFTETGSGRLPASLEGKPVRCKIRYAAKPADAYIYMTGENSARVDFTEKQRAPAPGQSLVVYCGDMVVGGGFIEYSE